MVPVPVCLAFISIGMNVEGFSFSGSRVNGRKLLRSSPHLQALDRDSLETSEDQDIFRFDDFEARSIGRRDAMRNAVLMSAAIASSDPSQAIAYPGELITNTEVDLDCLKDLPPIPNDCIRIFLCRHGQTENNRLRIVQGARVDPPLNINGNAQATNLGFALARADPKPQLFFLIAFKTGQNDSKYCGQCQQRQLEKAHHTRTTTCFGGNRLWTCRGWTTDK
mmetsp:Transcript_16418/g.37999  ORF Transcript_16418/g.37999 Transcript_16418/m.37999 type:complete len:222 (-) Transcript_16418:495-1160(-)